MFKKILIVNIFGIGDVLFTTPLVSNIKSNFTDVFIGYVCNARAAAVLADNPKIDKIFIYERDEFNTLYKKSGIQFLKKMNSLLSAIRNEGFDVGLDLSLNGNVSFLMALAGIKRRIGFNYKNRSLWLTEKVNLDGYARKHVVEYYLELLARLGVPADQNRIELFSSRDDCAWAEQFFSDHKISPKDFPVCIIPGGGASWGKDAGYKRWPEKQFALLADKMVEKFSAKVILLGDQNEKELCRAVKEAMKSDCLDIAGETTIPQMAALLAKCKLAIANDGGPLHVAVAVGTKTVSIFGPVDEYVYGPYPKDNHTVIQKDIACRPCYRRFRLADCQHHHCINSLGVHEVFEKIKESL
ncbi:MAG TPA: glycosyltransferase family 9 protein [Candidatus Omnitrophota bacterium]|nr:glycosyltransferase family 9 protein [Candidatus Omnitrophota bacterium]HPD84129.1 glycosyltransferase family 9 protein [Candidatus Omnitrophota bacterium]HRZ02986.1 glycosyltransferase family 9 protein [Candidatus Omnitrophota bacterium]